MFDQLRLTLPALTLAGLLAGSALADGEAWTEDFDGAQHTAESENKDLLLEFTGSDWCPPCMKLSEAVFSHEAFAEGAGEHFVLVKLDFPRDKAQSDELKAQNAELQDKYAIRGYPTVILADAAGRPYAQTGYRPGGPDEYLAHLAELKQARVTRDAHLDAASNAEGVEKAQHLHEAMQAVGDDMAVAFYEDTVMQIIELDDSNEAGLKAHYEGIYIANAQRKTLQGIMSNGDSPEVKIDQLEEMLASEDLLTAVRQEALAAKCQLLLFALEDKPAAKATLQAAIEADPDSEMAEMLRGAMERFFSEEEPEAAAE